MVEAGLILGLTAAGVSEADATAAVFIQRLFTSYLPPIWGWLHPRLDAQTRVPLSRRPGRLTRPQSATWRPWPARS